MDFVANFMENMTVKIFENRSTYVRLMNECIVAQFLLRHGVLSSAYPSYFFDNPVPAVK